jgi:hypothetical protein
MASSIRRMRSIWRYRSICLWGSNDPMAETLLRGAITVFTQNYPDCVRSHCGDEQWLFTRADTRSGPPRVPKERPAAQSAKPCLSEDAAELSHVVSDVYSSIRRPESPLFRNFAIKIGGGPAVFRRAPLLDQPACKPGSVWPAARTADVTTIPLARRLPGASSNLPERQIRTDPGFLPSRSYSVLLPVGFAVPLPSPEARCALTAPFHPCRG